MSSHPAQTPAQPATPPAPRRARPAWALSILIPALLLSAGTAQADSFDVRLEAPGVLNSTATFANLGRETFDSRAVGYDQTFATDFGTGGLIKGRYSAVQINAADVYGGADGAGRYAATFNTAGYRLDLSTSIKGGVNYFGFWLSALDFNDNLSFYRQGKKVFEFTASDATELIKNNKAYFGNPNPPFKGGDAGEPYAFVNFFDSEGNFDAIVFRQTSNSGGYESDNHTVGHYTTEGEGKLVQHVPEPGRLSLFALVLLAFHHRLRRRQLRADAAARRPPMGPQAVPNSAAWASTGSGWPVRRARWINCQKYR